MKMKIKIKKLKGAEYDLEVEPKTVIADIKNELSLKSRLPVSRLKLLLAGRTLADDQPVKNYPNIKDGTKLNLIVMKPEDFFEASVKIIRKLGLGYSEAETVTKSRRIDEIIDEKLSQMSLDDIDRLCADCLLLEQGELPSAPTENNEQDLESDDGF